MTDEKPAQPFVINPQTDQVILCFPQHLTTAQMDSLRESWRSYVGKHRPVILDGGAYIAAVIRSTFEDGGGI